MSYIQTHVHTTADCAYVIHNHRDANENIKTFSSIRVSVVVVVVVRY